MQVEIHYETKEGIKRVSYYPSFYRNKDLRDALIQKYFNKNNRYKNLELFKNRFVSFVEEKGLNKKEADKAVKESFEKAIVDDKALDFLLIPHVNTGSNSEDYLQFFANVFYNLVKSYFKSDAINLGLFLAANPDPEFAFIIPLDETSQWVELLGRYQYVELCPAMNWYRYQEKNPYPLKRLIDDHNAGKIIGNIVVKNEFFNVMEEEEDDFETVEEYEEYSLLNELELLKLEISALKPKSYISIKEIKEQSIFEYQLVEDFT